MSSSSLQTVVVDVHVASIRPTYISLKEWIDDKDRNYYIGRRGVILLPDEETGKKSRFPKEDSIFANPFKIGDDSSRANVIEKYEIYIRQKINLRQITHAHLSELRGKRLGCWCKPEACHGDVLVKILKEMFPEE